MAVTGSTAGPAGVADARYPAATIRADYARAGFGLAATAGPAVFLDPALPVLVILVGLSLLFGAHGMSTALRHASRYRIADGALVAEGPRPRRVDFAALRRVRLAWYATRRDGVGGWFVLTLSGAGGRIEIDSALPIFHEAVALAAISLSRRPLRVPQATRRNFAMLGHPLPEPVGG